MLSHHLLSHAIRVRRNLRRRFVCSERAKRSDLLKEIVEAVRRIQSPPLQLVRGIYNPSPALFLEFIATEGFCRRWI